MWKTQWKTKCVYLRDVLEKIPKLFSIKYTLNSLRNISNMLAYQEISFFNRVQWSNSLSLNSLKLYSEKLYCEKEIRGFSLCYQFDWKVETIDFWEPSDRSTDYANYFLF